MPPGSDNTIADVIRQMQDIAEELPALDGVACFNRMYLQVTELVKTNLKAGNYFVDDAFIERLDVTFAQLYLDAVGASKAGKPVNSAWTPLFTARKRPNVWPIQFALAGMNAHINHDLPLAVIATCEERNISPETPSIGEDYQRVNTILADVEQQIRDSFESDRVRLATRDAEPLLHVISSFSIAEVRDAAWASTQTLWHLRDMNHLYTMTLDALTTCVAVAGNLLLTPISAPPA